MANARVMRARSPSRPVSGNRNGRTAPVRPGACSPGPHGDDVARVGRVGLDLRAQPADVDVDEATVTEVAVAPDALEQHLAAEHPTGALGQLHQHAELGLGEVDVAAVAAHHPLVGDDLEVAEAQVRRAHLGGAGPAQQGTDPRRELLGREGLGEVVVGARLEPGHDVVGVGAGGDHHDRHIGAAPDRPAHLEAVDAREHDVDEHHVGGLVLEVLEGVLAGGGLGHLPALVLQGQPHRGADALVVLDGEDARGHAQHPTRAGAGQPV